MTPTPTLAVTRLTELLTTLRQDETTVPLGDDPMTAVTLREAIAGVEALRDSVSLADWLTAWVLKLNVAETAESVEDFAERCATHLAVVRWTQGWFGFSDAVCADAVWRVVQRCTAMLDDNAAAFDVAAARRIWVACEPNAMGGNDS